MVSADWKSLRLGEVLTLQRGFDLPSRSRNNGTIPIISSSGEIGNHNKAPVTGPGVVTGRYGTIGEVFFVMGDYWPLNTTLFVSDFKGNDPLFSSFLLKTIDFKSYSGKSGVPGVNRNDLHEVSVKLPPLPEQQAIAQALSDVDNLIDGLEKLIAKKRDIKTAAMQQLLTGKTRLPGFGEGKGYKQTELGDIPEDWSISALGDVVGKIVGGGTPSRSNAAYWGNEIPWVTVKDFASFCPTASKEYITVKGLKGSASNLVPKGTLIISTRMAVGKAVVYDVDVAINQDLKALFPKEHLDTTYFYYWFQQNRKKLEELGSGSTVKGLSLPHLKGQVFLQPLEKVEQQAIAQVLSDMDKELASLQSRLNKTKSLKQGMMQELLTGKTRLI